MINEKHHYLSRITDLCKSLNFILPCISEASALLEKIEQFVITFHFGDPLVPPFPRILNCQYFIINNKLYYNITPADWIKINEFINDQLKTNLQTVFFSPIYDKPFIEQFKEKIKKKLTLNLALLFNYKLEIDALVDLVYPICLHIISSCNLTEHYSTATLQFTMGRFFFTNLFDHTFAKHLVLTRKINLLLIYLNKKNINLTAFLSLKNDPQIITLFGDYTFIYIKTLFLRHIDQTLRYIYENERLFTLHKRKFLRVLTFINFTTLTSIPEIIQKICPYIERETKSIGILFFSFLLDLNYFKINNEKCQKINTIPFHFNLKRDIPYLYNPTTRRSEIRKAANMCGFIYKYKSKIKTYPDRLGFIKDKTTRDLLLSTKFNINYFLLYHILRTIQQSYALIGFNSSHTNEPEPDNPLFTSSFFLNFWSELYDINFLKYYKNANNDDLMLHFQSLIRAATYLHRHYKFTLHHDTVIGVSLKNMIETKKYTLNEFLFQALIMLHFNYFSYDYFCDFRGRNYYVSSALSPMLPLNRCILSFYGQVNVSKNQVILNNLNQQFAAICKTTINNTTDFDSCVRTLPFGTRFLGFNLMLDIVMYSNVIRKRNVCFISHYSKDSSSSGHQIMAMLTRSISYAKYVNLLNFENPDLYTYQTEQITRLISLLSSYFSFFEPYFYLIPQFLTLFSRDFTVITINDHLFIKDYLTAFKESMFTKTPLKQQLLDLYTNLLVDEPEFEVFFSSFDLLLKDDSLLYVFRLLKILLFFYLNNDPFYSQFCSRKVIKISSMIMGYGSSFHGRTLQMLTKSISLMLEEGLSCNNFILLQLKYYLEILNKMLSRITRVDFPSSFILQKCIYQISKYNAIEPLIFTSPFNVCYFAPKKRLFKVFVSPLIRRKLIKISLASTQIDPIKFRKGGMSNYIQFCDSVLLSIFLDFARKHRLFQVIVLHDRFFCHPYYSNKLNELLQKTYQSFCRMSYSDHFVSSSQGMLIHKRYTEVLGEKFEPMHITNPNIVKH